MNKKQNLTDSIRNLPTWIKGVISFITLIVGFVTVLRSDKQLIITIIGSILLTYILGVCLYILYKRDPSPFGGKGAFTYPRYHTSAKIGLVVWVLILIFLLVNHTSRQFVAYAIVGTPTPDYEQELLKINVTSSSPCTYKSFLLPKNYDFDAKFSELRSAWSNYGNGGRAVIDAFYQEAEAWPIGPMGSRFYIVIENSKDLSNDTIIFDKVKVSVDFQPIEDKVFLYSPYNPCGGPGENYNLPPIKLMPNYKETMEFKDFDYYKLLPGDAERFLLPGECEKPGLYGIEIEVPYIYEGTNYVKRQSSKGLIACPNKYQEYRNASDELSIDPYDRYELSNEYIFSGSDKFSMVTPSDKKNCSSTIGIYDNNNFEGNPINVFTDVCINKDIAITFRKDGGRKYVDTDSPFSAIIYSDTYFTGGKYKVSNGGGTGNIQVIVDNSSVTPVWSNVSSFDMVSADNVEISKGIHKLILRYKSDPFQNDADFSVHLEMTGN